MDTSSPNGPADLGSGVTSPQPSGTTGLPETGAKKDPQTAAPEEPSRGRRQKRPLVSEDPEVKMTLPKDVP